MNKKAFTLIELLVVVLIIAILAAIALPQYFVTVEKSRASEAFTLLASIAGAEERYTLTTDSPTNNLSNFDIEIMDSAGNAVTGSTFTTQHFYYSFTNCDSTHDLEDCVISATRGDAATGHDTYDYEIQRNAGTGAVTCAVMGTGTKGQKVCDALGL